MKSLSKRSIKKIPGAARLLKREQLGKEIKYFQMDKIWKERSNLLRQLRARRKLSPRIGNLRKSRFLSYLKEGSSPWLGTKWAFPSSEICRTPLTKAGFPSLWAQNSFLLLAQPWPSPPPVIVPLYLLKVDPKIFSLAWLSLKNRDLEIKGLRLHWCPQSQSQSPES